jgi:FkbM family methyltransferase
VRQRAAYDAPKFISHAGNFEDVMLWRALSGVTAGFYVDVGASDPNLGSVTRAFYERGWRGINVEPNPKLFRRLVAARPRDVNLEVALSDRPGRLEMVFARTAALSTLDPAEGARLAARGQRVDSGMVEVTTLAAIWRDHVPPGQPVHFLKVDVEGLEGQVFAGADWTAGQPWIVVAEATRPMTDEPSHDAWEPLLLAAGYRLVYEDGLNRFYVAAGHPELVAAFRFPPNVFDNFVQGAEGTARERALRAEAELTAMKASRSWWLTAPLRRVGHALRAGRRA